MSCSEVVHGDGVVIASVVSARAGVDGGLGEPGDVVEEAVVVVGLLGDGVRLGQGEVSVGDDLGSARS